MQGRVLALLVLGYSGILLTACGYGKEATLEEHRIARITGGSFAWSPDGRRFAYTSRHGPHLDLFVVDADGNDRRRLGHDGSGARTVHWSPDSRRIAYVSPHGGHSDLLVIDAAGSGKQRLSHDASQAPRWAPDGGRILFVSARGLSVVNADGSGERRLTRDDADYYDHSWSPDGRSIAFARRPPRAGRDEANPSIYVTNADGTARRRVTPRSEFADAPEWSPDGDRIAFVLTRFSPSLPVFYRDISVVDADGTDEQRLTLGTGTSDDPAWSPDGRTIAFESGPATSTGPPGRSGCRDCDHDVDLVDPDSGDLFRLTSAATGSTAPVWSPDGRRIAFRRSTGGGSAVFVMNADGSDQHQVTRNRNEQIAALWWPRSDIVSYAVVGLASSRNVSFFLDIFVAPVE